MSEYSQKQDEVENSETPDNSLFVYFAWGDVFFLL
jgi:hypothetical protein